MSNSRGVPYFFNTETQQSTWEPPAGLSQQQIDSLPGAHYLSGSGNGKVRASHLLVKHRDSRRPSSWKEVCLSESEIELARLNHAAGEDHQVEGGGHRDLEGTSERDQWLTREVRRACKGALGLLVCEERRRPWQFRQSTCKPLSP
jgi:hypothetical protein